MGWIALGIGILLMALAAGFIPSAPEDFNAPQWVVGLGGVIFGAGGVAMLFQKNGRIGAVMAAIILLSFAIMGLWVAFAGNSEDISGGLPFLSHAVNAKMGRWIFGLGAVVSLRISYIAIKDALRRNAESNERG